MNETVMDILKRMQDDLIGAIADAKKFEENENKAAGTRVTKTMQSIRKDAKDLRALIFHLKKEM